MRKDLFSTLYKYLKFIFSLSRTPLPPFMLFKISSVFLNETSTVLHKGIVVIQKYCMKWLIIGTRMEGWVAELDRLFTLGLLGPKEFMKCNLYNFCWSSFTISFFFLLFLSHIIPQLKARGTGTNYLQDTWLILWSVFSTNWSIS